MEKIKKKWILSKKSQQNYLKVLNNVKVINCHKRKIIIDPISTQVSIKTAQNKSEVNYCPIESAFGSDVESSQDIVPQNSENVEVRAAKEKWLGELENLEEENEEILTIEDHESNVDIFRKDLKMWAINNHHVKHHIALKDLFQIINTNIPNLLPRDPRTFLQTSKIKMWFKKVGTGEYWHQELRYCIQSAFADLNSDKTVSININIDGLPIYKSSKLEFWPIIFNVHEQPNLEPMIIGIYHGKGKPENLTEFFSPFIEEMNNVIENGITINNYKLTIKIRCFICDSPARAYLKGEKGSAIKSF